MELKRTYGTFGKVTDIARKENERNNFAKCGSDTDGSFYVDVDDTDNVIFAKLAKVAKVVFSLLDVLPGIYTAKGLTADCANKEYDRQTEKRRLKQRSPIKKYGRNSQTCGGVKESIYTYEWGKIDNCLSPAEDGKIRLSLGSYSCTFAPLTVFFLLDKFSQICTLSGAEKKELTTFTREKEEELTEVYSFVMPCDGKKILPFLAKDNLRPQLQGAYIDISGYIVGTDCYSVVAAPITITCKDKAELKSVICSAYVLQNAKKGDTIRVYKRPLENVKSGEGGYITECGTARDSTLSGNYPKWKSIFANSAHVATFSKKEFAELKKQAKSLKKIGGTKHFQLLLNSNGNAVIKAENADYNEQKSVDVSAYVIGDAHTFMGYERMNRLFLEGSEIKMYYREPNEPILFTTSEGFHFVVMPYQSDVEVSEDCYHKDDLEEIEPLDRPVIYETEACNGEVCNGEAVAEQAEEKASPESSASEEHVASSGSEECEELGRDERKDIGKNVGEDEGKAEGNGEAMEERVASSGKGECEEILSEGSEDLGGAIASEEHGSPNAADRCGRAVISPTTGDKSPTLCENSPALITDHTRNKNGSESGNKGPPQSFCVTYIYKQ